MIGAWRRRFWADVTLRQGADGWSVLLDARVLTTPGKLDLVLPTEPMAEAVAAEWRAVDHSAEPEVMPMTRLANAAVEKIAPDRQGMIAGLAAYAETDLLCYRADAPADLREREDLAWDPLLDWADAQYGARLNVYGGVLPGDQDREAVAALSAAVSACGPFTLSALGVLVPVTGSLVLGLAVLEGRLDAEAAFAVSRVDEDWQSEQWGEDAEAAQAAADRRTAMRDGARLLSFCRDRST